MSTVDEVKRKRQEKERQSRFAAPSFSDGKDHHTVDEIIGAARKQGLYPEQSVTRNASRSEKQIAIDSLAKKRAYDEQQRQSSPFYRGAKKISSAAYDLAFEAAKRRAENPLNKTPEQLQKSIDSKPFDYHDVESVKKALGAGENAAENADFYVKYRQHIIPHTGGEQEERYKGLDKLVQQHAVSTSNMLSNQNADRVAAKTDDGNAVNYGDLLRIKVAQNRAADVSASQKDAGKLLSDLATGNRKLTQSSQVNPDDLRAAGWSGNFPYTAYSIDDEAENKSAVFSPLVLDEKGNVQRIMSPSELEEYAKTALAQGSDPLNLQATETYNGAYGTDLASENAKRINRLSERYFNNTDLESLIVQAQSGHKKAVELLSSYGVDVDELQNFRYREDTKEKVASAAQAYSDWSKQNIATGAVATGANILASPVKAAEYVINLGEAWSNNIKAGGNRLSSYSLPANYDDFATILSNESTQAITEGIRDSIKGDGDIPFLNWLGDVAANTYGGVSSSVQSAFTGLTARAIFGPGIGDAVALGVMSGEAANDAYNEVLDNGGTVGQATLYSVAAGANEAIFEKISLENLMNIKEVLGKDGIKEILKSSLQQSFAEGSEEVFTEIANHFADGIINGDLSQYNRNVQAYIEAGYSEDEAKKKADSDFVMQLIQAGYGGFIGGGMSTGVRIASNTVQEKVKTSQQNKAEQRFSEQYIAENAPKIAENKGAESVLSAAQSIINDDSSDKTKALSEAVQAVSDLDENTEEYDRGIARVLQEAQKYQIERMRTVSHDTYKSSIKSRISEVAETGSALAENADTVADIVDKKTSASGYMEFVTSLNDQERSLYEANRQSIDAVAEYMQSEEGQAKSALDFENAYTQRREDYIKTAVGAGVNQESDFREELDTFDTSDDGKNYIKGEESPVEIERVTSISPESMVFELKDGRIVDGDDIDFGDTGLATVMKAVQTIRAEHGGKMAASFANAVYQAYQSGSYSNNISAFVHDVQNIYNSASSNMSYTPALLTGAVANTLRDAAVQNKQQNIQAKSKEIANRRTGTRRQGVVVYEDNIDRKSLKGRHKVAVEVVENLAKSTGITFRFYESKKNNGQWQSVYLRDKHGMTGQSPNGFYKNGEIYLDINAGKNGEGLILFTVSHELVHFMRDFSPESFDTYAKFLFDNYASKRLTLRQAIHLEMGHAGKLKYDEAYEEVVARLSESFLRDVHLTEKSKELYDIDKATWETVRDSLKRIAGRLKDYFASPDSVRGEIGQQMAAKNQEILDRFVAGVRAASENAAYTENTTGEGGVKNQERFSYDYFISKPDMSIASIDDSITHNRTETVRIAKENAKTFGYVDNENNPFVYIKDTDSYVKLGTDGLRHSLNRTKGFIYPVTENIGEILTNSIEINELLPKDANAKSTYVLIGTAQNKNGDLYLVRSIVNSYNNELASFDVLYAINTKKELAANKSPRYANNSLSATNSTISIRDLLDYVNRYYPQLLPEDVLKHYGYESRPKGDLSDSVLYQSREDLIPSREELDELLERERREQEKRINELKDHYKELRNNERQRRKKTEFRHKVLKMINGFNTLLNHPVEGKYVPRQFISQTVDFLKMINLDSGRSVNVSDKLSKLADKYGKLKEDNDNYASYDVAIERRIKTLSEMVDEEAKAWVPKRNKAIQYENKRRQREGKTSLKNVTEENFSIQNMSLELLQYTYDTLKSIQYIIRDSIKMTGEETKKNRVEVHKTLVQEIREVRKPHSGFARFYTDLAKSGYLMFKSFADYKKNSEWENRQNELNIGCIKRANLGLRLSKPFEKLIDDTKSFDKMIKTTVDIGLKDSDGNPVLITHDMLVCVYLDLLNSQNAEHVVGGGYHVPDLEEYHKGKIKQSYQGGSLANGAGIYAIDINQRREEAEQRLVQAEESGEDITIYERQIKELDKEAKVLKDKVNKYFSTIKSNVLASMTDYDRAWAKAWQDFNKMASEEINKTTLELYGFKKAVVDNYFPITVDQAFRSPTFDNIVMDMSLENWGSLKERVKGARGTILLQGISNVVAERIEKTSLFCGMAVPMRNFQKVYGVVTYDFSKQQGTKSEIQTTIQRELDKKFGDSAIGGGANTYIKKLLGDLTITDTESTPMDKLMSFVRNGIAVKTLTLNPRVWFTQAASYVTALPEVDIVSLAKGLGTIFYRVNPHWSAKLRKHIATVTPLYDLRRAGMSTPELGDLSKARSKNPISRFRGKTQKITNLTQFNDSIATGRLWYVAEFYIQKHTNLERGTVEFDKAVAEKYNKILQRTQPNYTPMERAQILRSKNAITKSFTMWKTQRLQNVNILMDAYGSFNKTLRDCNRHMNGATTADVGKAFVTCIKATIGVLASQFMIEALSAAVNILLYHSFKWFTGDDDDEMTFGSIMNGIWKNYLSSMAGNFIGGSEIESIVETIKDGKRWSPIEPGVLETVLDLANDTMDTVNVLQENGALSAKFATAVHDRIVGTLGFFGIAAKNAEKIYNGITLWIEDWIDKDIFQFTEIGDRVNQSLMERTIQELKDGDFHKMNNLAQDKYNEAYDKAWNNGKSEDECVSAGDSEAKSFITSTLKDEYVKANKNKDAETTKAIRKYMHQSGYYKVASGKLKGTVSASVADDRIDEWIAEDKKKQEEAEVAKERKGE